MAGDKPAKISATASKLDAQGDPEPFVYVTRENKRITFPDPMGMEWEEAEQFFSELNAATQTAPHLRKWLGDEQFDWLKADRLSLRKMQGLLTMVRNHYGAFMGSPGEDGSSPS